MRKLTAELHDMVKRLVSPGFECCLRVCTHTHMYIHTDWANFLCLKRAVRANTTTPWKISQNMCMCTHLNFNQWGTYFGQLYRFRSMYSCMKLPNAIRKLWIVQLIYISTQLSKAGLPTLTPTSLEHNQPHCGWRISASEEYNFGQLHRKENWDTAVWNWPMQ